MDICDIVKRKDIATDTNKIWPSNYGGTKLIKRTSEGCLCRPVRFTLSLRHCEKLISMINNEADGTSVGGLAEHDTGSGAALNHNNGKRYMVSFPNSYENLGKCEWGAGVFMDVPLSRPGNERTPGQNHKKLITLCVCVCMVVVLTCVWRGTEA